MSITRGKLEGEMTDYLLSVMKNHPETESWHWLCVWEQLWSAEQYWAYHFYLQIFYTSPTYFYFLNDVLIWRIVRARDGLVHVWPMLSHFVSFCTNLFSLKSFLSSHCSNFVGLWLFLMLHSRFETLCSSFVALWFYGHFVCLQLILWLIVVVTFSQVNISSN